MNQIDNINKNKHMHKVNNIEKSNKIKNIINMNNIINIEELIIKLTENFTKVISINEIITNNLYWGGNGVGDRWAQKKFNYSVIYSKKSAKNYSENDTDEIPNDTLNTFIKTNNKCSGIIGIFVHSKRINIQKRPINKKIHKIIINNSCVICGSNSDIICDHKNDLYNDERVLNTKNQIISDFQPLCQHCNLQKRQVCKKEEQLQNIYSAKNILMFKMFPFEFPWEKKAFDKTDINCKKDTYWFDPVEFTNKIYCYSCFVMPIINELKYKIKHNKIKLIE